MSGMLDQMEKDGETARVQRLMQSSVATVPTEISATAGEAAIQNDDQAIFAFSALAAAQ